MAAAPFFVAAETRRSPAHARRREHAPLDDSLERFPESVFRRRGLAGSPQKARRLNELERVSDSEGMGNRSRAAWLCDVHDWLTITSRLLHKRNYNTMNQAFIAIIVKIPAPKFTIPTWFMA
jgi:hypothetical protein